MLKPIKLKVLILPDGKITETKSGIYTGIYSVEGSFRRGTVVAVGSMVKELKEGDRVGYQTYSGNVVEHEGQKYDLMYETEVIGILNEQPDNVVDFQAYKDKKQREKAENED